MKKAHNKLKLKEETINSSEFNNVDTISKSDNISKVANETKVDIPSKTNVKISKNEIDSDVKNTIDEMQCMSEELKSSQNSQLHYSHRILQYPAYHS